MKYREVNLLGGFYKDASQPWSSQDTVNWLPAGDDSGQARSEMMLRGAPGLREVTFGTDSGGGGGGGGGGGIVVSPVGISGTPTNGERGVAYTFTFTASGGTGPYLWSLAAEAPPGLTINPTTGELFGTPTLAGSYFFVVVATDSTGLPASRAVSLRVTAPLGPEVALDNPDFATATGWTTVNQTATPGFSFQSGAGRTGPGFLRWVTSAALPGNYFGDTITNDAVVEADGNELNAIGFVRCTAAGPSPNGEYADILLGVQIFNDAACTVPANSNWQAFESNVSVRFNGVRDWVALFLNITPQEGKYYRLAFQCRAGLSATIEFDDCSWNARNRA